MRDCTVPYTHSVVRSVSSNVTVHSPTVLVLSVHHNTHGNDGCDVHCRVVTSLHIDYNIFMCYKIILINIHDIRNTS